MSNPHLTDAMIQQYVLDKSLTDLSANEHMITCEQCRLKASDYSMLFSEIQNLPTPSFNFNLAGLVMAQLPKQKKQWSWSLVLVTFSAIIIIAVPFYFFQQYFQDILAGMSILILSLIGIMILMILVFQILEEYRKYDKRISSLDF